MEGPRSSKSGHQVAAEDSRREVQVKPEKLATDTEALKPTRAQTDANRTTEVKMPKKINEEMKARFLKKGMPAAEAEKYAEEDDEDGDDNVSKAAEKALDEVQKAIKAGDHLFTQADIDAANSAHTDAIERVLAQHTKAWQRTSDRVANMEKALSSLMVVNEQMSKSLSAHTVASDELRKSLTVTTDELRKSLTDVKPVVVDEPVKDADDMKKALTGDNKPVDTAKAVVTEIPSPNDPAEVVDSGVLNSNADVMRKSMTLIAGGVSGDIKRKLEEAQGAAVGGMPFKQVMAQYGDYLKG